MISILFVDDEMNILDGLKRMLRSLRHEWDMAFAISGAEALSILENKEYDVIVSDMKMPGMDGSQLLQAVKNKYPHTIRLILSGYSEKEIIMQTVNTAHQYMSKPCDSEFLKATVKRVCTLRNLLTDEHLRRLVSQMPNVPSLPVLYGELIDELGKNEPSTRKVGEIVKKDIGMTVKILQIVNSAFFGLQRRLSSSTEAVELLGLDTISSLTLGLGVISQFQSHVSGALFSDIWSHSIAVGVLAHKIALIENRETANDAFTAGLLHDIGRVVLAVNLPDQFQSVEEIIKGENISRIEAEKRVFDATHSEVGAYLLGLWGLPTQVVQAVAFHNTPSLSETNTFSPLTAVHAANAIQNFINKANPEDIAPNFDLAYLAKIGMLERTPIWLEKYTALELQAV